MDMVLSGSISHLSYCRPKLFHHGDSLARAGLSSSFKFGSMCHRSMDYYLSSPSRNSYKNRQSLMHVRSSQSSAASPEPISKMAILLEVEGVIADVHKFGHRLGFNLAFQEFNLECANWSEPVYADLLRHAGGSEEAMLRFFSIGCLLQIGWLSSLPTNDKDAFVRNIVKAKMNGTSTGNLAALGDLSLRPGFTEFVDEVLEAKVPLVVLAAYSKSREQVVRSLIAQLGPERTRDISVVGEPEVESSAYGQVVLGGGVVAGLDEQLAMEAAKAGW